MMQYNAASNIKIQLVEFDSCAFTKLCATVYKMHCLGGRMRISVITAIVAGFAASAAYAEEINPTAENIARIIYNNLRKVISKELELNIKVYETERNIAEYPARK